MEISKEIETAFNKQIQEELFSSYLYFSMQAFFDSVNLTGLAHWMQKQAQEEFKHAMKFYNHINERAGRVEIPELKKPQKEWNSALEAFKDAYKHEKYITEKIHELVALSRKEKDYSAEVFLHWFVEEQIEEEDSARNIMEKLELIKDNPNALFMLDAQLAKRE
ncbi:MAG: ferritin [Candidatus Diapherotrites archaeon]|nr:ferritin [Candidatus Diapherotrites archaeon]